MLSNKESIKEIHGLAAQYSRKLLRYRDFFGKFNGIQEAQYNVVKKIGKSKKITKITSILKGDDYEVNNQIILNGDLLQKDYGYSSLRWVQILFVLITLPVSLPMLMFLSKITRGTFNFLKTDGSIFVEKTIALCESVSNQKSHEATTTSYKPTLLNMTKWMNNMLSMVEFRRRYFTSNISHYFYDDNIKSMILKKKKIKNGSSLNPGIGLSSPSIDDLVSDHNIQTIEQSESEKYKEMALAFIETTTSSISSFSCGFFSTRKKSTLTSCSLLDEAILMCELQDEKQIEDLTIITDALANFNQEQGFYNKQMLATKDPIKQMVMHGSFSREVTDASALDEPMDKRECTQMLREYRELMDHYPQFSNTDPLTLDSVESYHAASEAHHEKVLSIAECLVPELSSLLRQSRPNKEHPVSSCQSGLK